MSIHKKVRLTFLVLYRQLYRIPPTSTPTFKSPVYHNNHNNKHTTVHRSSLDSHVYDHETDVLEESPQAGFRHVQEQG